MNTNLLCILVDVQQYYKVHCFLYQLRCEHLWPCRYCEYRTDADRDFGSKLTEHDNLPTRNNFCLESKSLHLTLFRKERKYANCASSAWTRNSRSMKFAKALGIHNIVPILELTILPHLLKSTASPPDGRRL
jgi:hypothetical protein